MEIEQIIEVASEGGLSLIALTDHVQSVDDGHIPREVMERLPVLPTGLRVLVGCEGQMMSPTEPSLNAEVASSCQIVLMACNHYHLRRVEEPVDRTPKGWACHHLAMIRGAVATGYCHIIAHPFVLDKVAKKVDIEAVMAAYDRQELRELMAQVAQAGVAFELNPGHVARAFDFMQEVVQMGQKAGCRFSVASDAHRLEAVDYGHVPGGRSRASELLKAVGLGKEDLWSPDAVFR